MYLPRAPKLLPRVASTFTQLRTKPGRPQSRQAPRERGGSGCAVGSSGATNATSGTPFTPHGPPMVGVFACLDPGVRLTLEFATAAPGLLPGSERTGPFGPQARRRVGGGRLRLLGLGLDARKHPRSREGGPPKGPPGGGAGRCGRGEGTTVVGLGRGPGEDLGSPRRGRGAGRP